MTHAGGRLGKKILVIIDQGNLKTSWMDAFMLIWGVKLKQLTSSTVHMSDCMITTFQLLAQNKMVLNRVRTHFGTCLIDECQVTKAASFKQALFRLDNAYRMYCTATFNCKSIPQGALEDLTAPISVTMVDKEAMKPDVFWRETAVLWCSAEPMDFGNKILSELAASDTRNAVVFGAIRECWKMGRKTAVICINKKQASLFGALAKGMGAKVCVYTGSTSMKQDDRVKAEFLNGDLEILFSCKKLNKGYDIECLDALIMGKPNNSHNDSIQLAGRVCRKFDGKPTPIVIDFLDKGVLSDAFAVNRDGWYAQAGGVNRTPDLINAARKRKSLKRAA
jgi:superfamily II DNA or RNA helicase